MPEIALTTKQKKRSVLLGVTGSIAAYKAAELASLLVKQGHDVFVVMTKDARQFITPLTLQTLSKNPVTQSWHPGHIALADRADLLVIAPATAHIIAELAHGLAGHPLAAIALATRAPILLAPAMNGKMWEHPATKENVAMLGARGVEFIGPEAGMLACGYEGIGRLWKVDEIAFRGFTSEFRQFPPQIFAARGAFHFKRCLQSVDALRQRQENLIA